MGVDPATGRPAPYGSVGVDINCAVIGFTDEAPTANLAEPVPGSQFPPRQAGSRGGGPSFWPAASRASSSIRLACVPVGQDDLHERREVAGPAIVRELRTVVAELCLRSRSSGAAT